LLLGDHGYAPANPPEWIANLRPQLVLLNVAYDDKQGLPSPETLEAVAGYSLLRTDEHGWIAVSTDGQRMWVGVVRR
jgi:beta-lactamase superfamily II metal-dependent hydrolase